MSLPSWVLGGRGHSSVSADEWSSPFLLALHGVLGGDGDIQKQGAGRVPTTVQVCGVKDRDTALRTVWKGLVGKCAPPPRMWAGRDG